MGLAELLALAPRDGSPQRAAARLYLELKSLLSSISDYQRLQDAERDDLLHEISAKLLSLGPIPLAGKDEDGCRAYVRRMFINLQIERARKSKRETVVEDPPELEQQPTAEAMSYMKRVGELLERVYQTLWETRRERYRAELEKDWAEMHGMLSGERDMEQVLLQRERVGPETALEARTAAAQRIYKRHSRLRHSLIVMARKMADEGRLTVEEFDQVENLAELMDRSQQKGGKP